jgi:hypothetical protein
MLVPGSCILDVIGDCRELASIPDNAEHAILAETMLPGFLSNVIFCAGISVPDSMTARIETVCTVFRKQSLDLVYKS